MDIVGGKTAYRDENTGYLNKRCTDGQYFDGNSCIACNSSCTLCAGSSTECIQCANNKE